MSVKPEEYYDKKEPKLPAYVQESIKTYDAQGNPIEIWHYKEGELIGKTFIQYDRNGNIENIKSDFQHRLRQMPMIIIPLDKLRLAKIINFPTEYALPNTQITSLQDIRLLTSSDIVTIANLLNPHPISNPNLDVALSTRLKKEDLNLDVDKDLQVDVKTLPSLPAGTAKIGVVDIDIPKTFKTAKIDHATAGDNAIVAAVAGKRIKVYAIVLVVSAAVNCKWRSAVTDLTGDMNFSGKGEGYAQAVQPPAFLLATAAGEALNLNLSAAVAVDGHVSYWDNDSE